MRTSPCFEARWHESLTPNQLNLLGYSKFTTLKASLAQNISQGLTWPNHWQYHLAWLIEACKIINDIIKIESGLTVHFGFSMGICGFALKEQIDTSTNEYRIHGILHPFEIKYISVLMFFLRNLEFFTVLHIFLLESARIQSIPVNSRNSVEWKF